MKKILFIAWKDFQIAFRDISALVVMLITPFALTLAIGFAFGGIDRNRGSTGPTDIPVIIVNKDEGPLGHKWIRLFQSDQLSHLVNPTVLTIEPHARIAVDDDRAAAAIIIPVDFSASLRPGEMLSPQESPAAENREGQSIVEVYINPTRPISSRIVSSIVDRFLNTIIAEVAYGQIIPDHFSSSGPMVSSEDLIAQSWHSDTRSNHIPLSQQLITLESSYSNFDWLSYSAPSMAILFLMLTVTSGGRSILVERESGTLQRLFVSPNVPGQIWAGKVIGIYFTGLTQMLILILAGHLFFDIRWGNPIALVLLLITLVAAATSWGLLIAAYARTPGQVSSVGIALALMFGAGAGNFLPRQALPEWLRFVSYISPNAWGLEGFSALLFDNGISAVLTPVIALSIMAIVLLRISIIVLRHRSKSQM